MENTIFIEILNRIIMRFTIVLFLLPIVFWGQNENYFTIETTKKKEQYNQAIKEKKILYHQIKKNKSSYNIVSDSTNNQETDGNATYNYLFNFFKDRIPTLSDEDIVDLITKLEAKGWEMGEPLYVHKDVRKALNKPVSVEEVLNTTKENVKKKPVSVEELVGNEKNSQNNQNQQEKTTYNKSPFSKMSFGIGLGLSQVYGEVFDDTKTGVNLTVFDISYRLNEKWGFNINLKSSGHQKFGSNSAIGLGYVGFGPMYTIDLLGTSFIEIKPQIAMSMETKATTTNAGNQTASGYILAGSLVLGKHKKFLYSIDLDIVSGQLDQNLNNLGESQSRNMGKVSLGFGIRSNLGKK